MKHHDPASKLLNRRAGFTLIEIMLVVVIVGMLATLLTISIPKQLDKARKNKATADIAALATAVQAYYMDEGKYPASLDALASGEEPYLEKGIPKDPWGRDYIYAYPGSHKPFKFDITSLGADGATSDDDIANWKQDTK